MRKLSFTLVELLVVISAIGLLMAMLVPAMRSSRLQANAVLCGSNIKQLVTGLITYENENDTFPYGFDRSPLKGPPPGGYPGGSAYDRRGCWWFNYITDYSKKDKSKKTVLWCPSRQIKDPKFEYVLHGNYGVNQSICKSSRGIMSHAEFIGRPLSSADILYPSQTLLVVDSGYSMINWWHATDTPPEPLGETIEDMAYVPGLRINKDKALWPGQKYDAIHGRHPNKTVNVGFADGHISRKKANDLLVDKTADGYKNMSPLWVPR